MTPRLVKSCGRGPCRFRILRSSVQKWDTSRGEGSFDRIAQIRRSRSPVGRLRGLFSHNHVHTLRFEHLVLDPDAHASWRNGRPLELTPTEFHLLELFLRNPGRLLTREEIYADVWGFDFGPGSNLLSVYVGYLRKKTEAGGEPRLLHNVRGIGYVLRRDS
jgi:DNA-binding response OmpR family regulator